MLRWLLMLCLALCRLLSARPQPTKRSDWKRTRLDQHARQPRKFAWAIDEPVHLKALMPTAGCRLVADCFNRRFAAKKQISVSKPYVAYNGSMKSPKLGGASDNAKPRRGRPITPGRWT